MKTMSLLLILFFQLQAGAHNTVRNGGDAVAAEFVSLARLTVKSLKSVNLEEESLARLQIVENSLDTVQVNSQSQLFLNEDEVDAINYPLQKKIVISRTRWAESKFMKFEVRIGFVLHEYLGVSGFDDQNYQLSNQYMEKLNSQVLENLILQDSLLQSLSELHSIFWYYQSFSESLSFGEFCMTTGELRLHISKVASSVKIYSGFIKSKVFERKIKDLNFISSSFKKMCVESRDDTAQLNLLSNQGLEVISDLESYLLR